jgi:hypothetical protein
MNPALKKYGAEFLRYFIFLISAVAVNEARLDDLQRRTERVENYIIAETRANIDRAAEIAEIKIRLDILLDQNKKTAEKFELYDQNINRFFEKYGGKLNE